MTKSTNPPPKQKNLFSFFGKTKKDPVPVPAVAAAASSSSNDNTTTTTTNNNKDAGVMANKEQQQRSNQSSNDPSHSREDTLESRMGIGEEGGTKDDTKNVPMDFEEEEEKKSSNTGRKSSEETGVNNNDNGKEDSATTVGVPPSLPAADGLQDEKVIGFNSNKKSIRFGGDSQQLPPGYTDTMANMQALLLQSLLETKMLSESGSAGANPQGEAHPLVQAPQEVVVAPPPPAQPPLTKEEKVQILESMNLSGILNTEQQRVSMR